MSTRPACNCRATRLARSGLDELILAIRPNSESFARRMASAWFCRSGSREPASRGSWACQSDGSVRGYVGSIRLDSADKLILNKADHGRVVVIEYEIRGTILATGARYENRFCSIIELGSRKITHWRDYMDSHAAWIALSSSAKSA